MKKTVLSLFVASLMTVPTMAAEPNPNIIHNEVKTGYSIGYTIDHSNVIGSDFHIWYLSDGHLTEGWYVAYDLENGDYYYISDEVAQNSLEK